LAFFAACFLLLGATVGTRACVPAALEHQERPARNDMLTLAFMGDTMLGRLVSRLIPHRQPSWFWGDTLPLVGQADLRLLNLETPITTADTHWTGWTKAFYYKACPEAIDVLKTAGIDYVTLANNHMLDFSAPGLRDTIQALDKAGIAHSGAGCSRQQTIRPVILEAAGRKVGVFSFADHYREWSIDRLDCGIFWIQLPPTTPQWNLIEQNIEQLRPQCDLVVVSVHWGPNMRAFPSPDVRRLAHRLIDAGVDIIHGHSAHVFHGVEIYRGRPILYDTGEFIDDYAVDAVLRNDLSLLYLVRVGSPCVQRVEMVPVAIDEMQVNVAQGEDREKILELLNVRMHPFSTRYVVRNGYITIPVGRKDK
jgi:poly-gamma-glutamate synthesis protein (capsule biosynthesis protein)